MRTTYWIQRVSGELLVDRHMPQRFRASPDLFLELTEEQYQWALAVRTTAQARLETLRNAHPGEACHIFGNGPSLNAFAAGRDWSGKLSIGVNAAAHEIRPLRYWISADDLFQTAKRPLYTWVQQWLTGPDRPQGLVTLARWNARLVVQQLESMIKGKADAWLPDHLFGHSPQGPADDLTKGLYWTASSSQAALDLARHMGCARVYLWGLDYTDRSHSYTGAPGIAGDAKDNPGKPWDDYAKHVAGFTQLKSACAKSGLQIYNANPDSRLEVFQKVDPQGAFDDRALPPAPRTPRPPQRVEYFTFFTAGTPYERLAAACVEAFDRHGLRVSPVPYGNGGDWMKNALARAPLLAAIAAALPRSPVGLLDSDVEPLACPVDLFALPPGIDAAAEDRGANVAPHNRFSAGVCVFNATEAGRVLLQDWARRCVEDREPHRVLREQKYLHDAILAGQEKGLRFLNLGNRYNRLPEQRRAGDDTVLLHTPASRKLLQVIGGKR